ncbi:retropepsin-like aspartic protease family protein [Synechocystis sp. PCC 7509]|uniref:retropepsin-like aspartic protease family protein n=1 Tax=Synechocystis sp. PCC 7509 TaxID=927677 RepID=UPI0002ABF130|nr:retropepsin-like aspartic protease [Synechocystis sp. PCC 7509]
MKRFLSVRLELILLTGILGLIGTACNSFDTSNSSPPKQNTPVVIKKSPLPQATKLPSSPVETDRFEMALDKAYGALTISQSAQGAEDWRLIALQWSEAIALMKTVPVRSPYKAIAQKKIIQYQQNLNYAQQQAIRPIVPPAPVVAIMPMASEPPILTPSGVFQAVIKSRHGGTPVIDVTFNGGTQFEMIVDTGASGTVITQQMAAVLGVVPIGRATANTASDRNVEFSIGKVNSIEVGGAIVKNVPVAIAPTANLDIGLLGQDFFSNYDVTIKRDVVEFRPR